MDGFTAQPGVEGAQWTCVLYCTPVVLEDELAPRMEAETKAAKVGNPDWVNPSGGRIVPHYESVKDFPELLPIENYKKILQLKIRKG